MSKEVQGPISISIAIGSFFAATADSFSYCEDCYVFLRLDIKDRTNRTIQIFL